jgi:hypothetical protein
MVYTLLRTLLILGEQLNNHTYDKRRYANDLNSEHIITLYKHSYIVKLHSNVKISHKNSCVKSLNRSLSNGRIRQLGV